MGYVEYPALETGIIRDDPKMDQGEISMISIEQIRAARGLLGWSQTELAEAANRSLVTIKRLERDDAEGPVVSDDVRTPFRKLLKKPAWDLSRRTGAVRA
jgi:ribosome-binding protein aMBF1 (putative translation factor)